MVVSTALSLTRSAVEVGGLAAPRLLTLYAGLTYLNRTSRSRPIRGVPRRSATRGVKVGADGRGVDVVVPIFNNFDGTQKLLEALRWDSAQLGGIILVNDASTDARIAPMLRAFCKDVAGAVLVENEQNSGFVATCNRGLASSTKDVVILNTDIELPRGAVARLAGTLRSAPNIATVTPLSNNAYCAGIPHLNYVNERPFAAATDEIDKAFQSLGALEPIDVPRGVGFCMAMSRDVVERIGSFSPEFDRGYGEEADFSLRARQLGYRNVIAPNIYVYHAGGESFGSAWQTAARLGLLRLLHRHPSYVGLMREYLASSSVRAVGFAALVGLARQISGRDIRIFIGPNGAPPSHNPDNGPILQTDLAGSRIVSQSQAWSGSSHLHICKRRRGALRLLPCWPRSRRRVARLTRDARSCARQSRSRSSATEI